MVIGKLASLRRDQVGTAIMEFAVVAGVMIIVLFGIVEFSNLYSQWNAATKAVQVGARLASVSAPVWTQLTTLDGLENGDRPGTPLTIAEGYDYKVICDGSLGTCVMTIDNIDGNQTTVFSDAAMDNLVFGRGSNACGDAAGTYFGMCDIYRRVERENVRITYQHTNTGYASRPGGLVPTITVELIGLNYQFVFLDDIMGIFNEQDLNQVPIPGLVTTMIAEDMRSGAPTF